jgi:hypothetical protein
MTGVQPARTDDAVIATAYLIIVIGVLTQWVVLMAAAMARRV